MSNNLKSLFEPEQFRSLAYEMVDLLAKYLTDIQSDNISVNQWTTHEELTQKWKQLLSTKQTISELSQAIIQDSMHIHHPRYVGHQVSAVAPQVAVIDMMISLLNNGMGVFEMGAAGTVIENTVIEKFCNVFGLEKGSGFFTSGGTLANLTVMLAARQAKGKIDVWEEGSQKQMGLLVSEQAHYCIDRAARIMGWGSKGVIKIPVDDQFRIKTELIPDYIEQARADGIELIAIVGCAPSTSTGNFDDLNKMADYAEQFDLWFHVDAAHGGPAIFSDKYKYLLAGVERADSIILDTHKMMLTSAIATAVLFKSAKNSFSAFRTKANYLWEDKQEEDWVNLAKRTFECTKPMLAARVFFLWQIYGLQIFDEHVRYLFDLAKSFESLIGQDLFFKTLTRADSNIVCFRWDNGEMEAAELNQFNARLRQHVLEQGRYYIVQTLINDTVWLRVSLMNPMTTEEHLVDLLSYLTDQVNILQTSNVA